MHFLVKILAVGALLMSISTTADAGPDPENTLVMELKDGKVVIDLLADLAPGHVERIKELTRSGFYDGLVFHRVIDGFMAQTGDPTGTTRLSPRPCFRPARRSTSPMRPRAATS